MWLYRARFEFPSFRIAIGQLLLSVTHWPATAAIIYVLLNGKIDFFSVLGAYMLTSVAVLVAHMPAGLGVLEGMFIVLLGQRVSLTGLLAALLAFRAFFHVGALCVAGPVYLAFETRLIAASVPPGSGSRHSAGQVVGSDLPRSNAS